MTGKSWNPLGIKHADGKFDVVFVNAPHFNVLFPPSGIAHLCEAVRRAGFSPAVADINNSIIRRYKDSHVERFWHVEHCVDYWMGSLYGEVEEIFGGDFDEVAAALAKLDAGVIGFSVNMFNLKTTDRIAGRMRELAPGKAIIYGGYSCYHEEMCRSLSPQPDYICVGESEDAIVSLMRAMTNGGDPAAVPGVIKNRNGSNKYVPSARREDLDTLAWPTWKEFNLDNYKTINNFTTVSVNASRGCAWGRCYFCSDFNSTPGFRRRSAQSLVDEMRYNFENNGVGNFHLSDLIVNGDHAELEKFCDLIIASGLKICFSGQFHLDKRLTPKLLGKLRRAGMPIINFGIETGSDRVMKLMRKGHNIALVERVLKDSKSADLVTDVNMLVGFPGETVEDIEETREFLRRNRPVIDIVEVVNICSIQYGSPLWELHERFNVVFGNKPGVREERLWVSSDGTNTFEERARRASILHNDIESLKIGKGYHSQKFKFMSSGGDIFDDKIFRINLASQLQKGAPAVMGGKVLVLRSCGVDQAVALIETLVKCLPGSRIDLLCQSGVTETLAPKLNGGKCHEYEGGPLSLENVAQETIQLLRDEEYALAVLPYGAMPAYSYSRVRALVGEINAAKTIAVTMPGDMEPCVIGPPQGAPL